MTTFDAVAHDYDVTVERSLAMFGREIDFFHRNKIHHLARVARRANIDLQAAHVLDIGCGTGAADRMLRPMVSSLAGADVSSEMVAEAKEQVHDIVAEVHAEGDVAKSAAKPAAEAPKA